MRPKLLEIEGLQSFRDVQGIDFETLGATGLFGIFGPTGSGKSTVLDAITFALYGKVKRADGGTQGIINTNQNTARVAFTFELTRDGERKTFRVERTYQRRKGTVNSCEPKVARLIEITKAGEIPVCDKATEVSGNIKQLLGLSHEDFTRAVVLPQNSFQEFLLLNNSERRKMLERIFYLEEYGEHLQQKLNRKMTKLKSRLDVLSGELKGYADATGEALEEAKKAMDAAVSEKNRVERELRLLETGFNEAKEVWALVQELLLVDQKEHRHMAFREAISEKRTQLERSVKAGGLLEMIQKNKELKEKLQETGKQLEEILAILPGVDTSLGEIRQKYEGNKSETAVEQPELVGLRTRLVDALNVRGEIQALLKKIGGLQAHAAGLKSEIAGKNKVIEKETGELEALEQSLDRLKAQVEPLKTAPEYRQQIQAGARLESEVQIQQGNVKELEAKAGTLKGTIAGLEQKLGGVSKEIALSQKALEDLNALMQKHGAAMPEDRNSVLKYMERLHTLQAVYDVLKVRKNELDIVAAKVEKQRSALKELAQKALLLGQNRDKAASAFEQNRLDLDSAAREMDRNAACMLAQNLHEGEPCPVCGSQHHPRPAVHAGGPELPLLEKRFEKAREELALAEKTWREAERAVLVAQEQVKALAGQIDQAARELDGKSGEYHAEKKRLPEELRELELKQIGVELERMNGAAAAKLKSVDAWENRQEEYKEELSKLSEIVSEHRLLENGFLAELKVNHANLDQTEKLLAQAKVLLDEKQQEYSAFLGRHKIDGAAAELQRLAASDHKLSVLQKQMEQIQASAGQKRTLLDKWKEELRVLNDVSIKVEADISNSSAQKDEKESKLKELAKDADIEGEIRRIDQRLAEYASLEKQYFERLEALKKRHNELVSQRSLLENQQSIYSVSLQTEEVRLQTAMAEKGFADLGEVERSVLPGERQKAIKDEIDEYDRSGTNIQAQKEMVEKKLNSRSITEEEWNRTKDGYQELAAFKEECISRSEVARNNFNNIQSKHDKWVELDKSYGELSHKQGLLEQIQKLLKAEHRKDNSFIDFIAEERLRYVAAKASETLGLMTKYKYALEMDTDAGFIIRDNANGGVHRMVNSLSGGETFLTALSLALALSEQIQLKGQSPLEFFFLDEGFGTLDNDLLDCVTDALERLSRKERIIGLISHVPELRNRIARRLIVDPPTSQGDGSRVRVERA